MTEVEVVDYEAERKKDMANILESTHKKKVILAGPGTGKSHLLAEAIKVKKKQGKTKFHAITFLGKLRDNLADDLASLATATTLHGFARDLVLSNKRGWNYFPEIKRIIQEDLKLQGHNEVSIGDPLYIERSEYYKAVGHDDVVYYANQICKADKNEIPLLDLLLIDEFQDFNEIEDEFICLLAEKNEIIIVGDDDQALYKWKDAHPKFIRQKHDASNTEYESHTLRWCTRCPEVIIGAFSDITTHYADKLSGRTDKEYLCYYPSKQEDNRLNPKINVINSGFTSIARNIRFELEEILKNQPVKSVLIVGEAKSCITILSTVARYLKEGGFNNVDYKSNLLKPFSLNNDIVDGYKFLKKHNNPALGWRLVATKLPKEQLNELILTHFSDLEGFIASLDQSFKTEHMRNANTMLKLIKGPRSAREAIVDSSVESLQEAIVATKKKERELLTEQLVIENHHLSPPLSNLDITVCSIMGSKGLGADVVFVVGFDQGKLPVTQAPSDEEIYQLLVALTRTKKRLYLVNTTGCQVSSFLGSISSDRYERISQPQESDAMVEEPLIST